MEFYYNLIKKLAKGYIKKTNPYIIWITWSVGKTTCRMIITKILNQNLDRKIYTSKKNFNWKLWFPFSVFQIDYYKPWVFGLIKNFFIMLWKRFFQKPPYEIAVLEYWIDQVWEMDFLLEIAKPDFWIVTNIDKVHCMNLKSPDITAEEKYKLAYSSKNTVFLNYDDPYAHQVESIKADCFYYNVSGSAGTDIDFENYEIVKSWTSFYSEFDLKINNITCKYKTNLIWKENAWYVWIGLVIADILYYLFNNQSILEQQTDFYTEFELQEWRFSIFEWINDNIIIDSSYNASPSSVKQIINNTLNIKTNSFKDYGVIFVLGDMRELGDYAEQEHRKIAWMLANWDYVFLLGENTQNYTYEELLNIGFEEEKIKTFWDCYQLWNYLKEFLEDKDNKFLIMFKWSQNTIFLEESIKYIIKNKEDISKLPRQEGYWKWKK